MSLAHYRRACRPRHRSDDGSATGTFGRYDASDRGRSIRAVIETARIDPPPHEVRLRIRMQRKRLYRRGTWTGIAVIVGPAAGFAIGTAAGLLTRAPTIASIVALVIAASVFGRSWLWLRDPVRRAGWEVAADHARREYDDWKRAYGAPPPYGLTRQRRWLEEHPFAPGSAGVLLMMGLLHDADAAAARIEIHDEGDWFDVANLWATRQWAAGHPVEMDRLRAAWALLQDPRTRRDKRECVAAIESLVEGEAGADAWAVLARARPELGAIAPAAQVTTMIRNGVLLAFAGAGLAGVAVAWFT